MDRSEHVFFWATVESLSPLTVRRDGETAPMGVSPSVLVDPALLRAGDRVWCQLQYRRALVLGVAGGIRIPEPPEPPKPEPLTGPWSSLVLSSNNHDWSGTARYRRVPRGVELYLHLTAGFGSPSGTYVAGFPSSSGIRIARSWYSQCSGAGGAVGTFYAVPSTSDRNFLANHDSSYLRVSTVIPDYCLSGV